ncbi:MAG: MMPL family transporter [Azoarcus sp.]|nr:MMPL family transporter [Azoarcus sp.]
MNNPTPLPGLARLHRLLAGVWLVLLLGAACFLIADWRNGAGRVETDLLALLPRDERRPMLETALKALAAQGERQLALLVSARDDALTRQVAAETRAALAGLGLVEQGAAAAFPSDFYFPYRQGLLSAADREWLATATPEAAASRALKLAHALFTPANAPWHSDPYGFFGDWLKSLGEATPVRPFNGELMVEHDGRSYAALTYVLPQSAFSSDFQQKLIAALDGARARAHALDPQARFLAAGVALHAAAAARQAEREMRLIGLGSLLGTFFLIGFVFQSVRALKLIAISLVSGAVVALFATFLLFERVHAVTLVFGVSLIGVAVDYAILVFAQHLGSQEPPWERYRRLLPTLGMALLTPALAYLALALTPFPGLEQMAVFAVCGIFGAWASVVCFYPYLLPATLPPPGNAGLMTRLLARWPRWRNSGRHWRAAFCLAAVAAGGLAQLRTDDDIRGLFSGDAALMAEHRQASEILRLPSPAQMFLLDADTPETLLQNEETLLEHLRPLVAAKQIGGYEAVSRWLPSEARQRQARALRERLRTSDERLGEELELPGGWSAEASPGPLLTPEVWLASPVSASFRGLWLGAVADDEGMPRYASVALLQGLAGREAGESLARLARGLPGVEWVDQTREVSSLMARYRELLTRTLLLACLAVPFLLYPFFGRRVWRIVAPVSIAGALTLAVMGYLGIPLQLLNILAFLLALGMGVDYAIFLQARQAYAHTLLATTLAASLTLLSFGLLAFSGTPALHALGLTITLGVALSWLLTPVFLRDMKTQA